MAEKIDPKKLECGDLVRILLWKSDIVAYVWNGDFLEKKFGLEAEKIKGLEDCDIIFSSLNPYGTTFDEFTDNLQFIGTYFNKNTLKTTAIKDKPRLFDKPLTSVKGYELIKARPGFLY